MSRNYYLSIGGGTPPTLIGTATEGWTFALRVYPEHGISDIDDWIDLFSKHPEGIDNEDGNRVTLFDMMRVINSGAGTHDFKGKPAGLEKADGSPYTGWLEYHSYNESCAGPHGLLRRRIRTHGCVGHGAGPWDLINP